MPALSSVKSVEALPLADTMSNLDMLPHAPQPRRRRRRAVAAQDAQSNRPSESSESESESDSDSESERDDAPKTTRLGSPSSSFVSAPSPVAGSVTTVTVTPSLTTMTPVVSSTALPLAPGTGSKQKPSEEQKEKSPKKSQAGRISGGAEAGIVLGILGFLALVFISIILYRRYRRSRSFKGFKLSEKPSEKIPDNDALPPPPPPKPNAQRSTSSIMDDAMQAVYAAEKQPQHQGSRPDFQTRDQPYSSRSPWLNQEQPPVPPSPSRSTWLTKQGEPSSSQSTAWLEKGKARAIDDDMPLNPPANILRAQSLTPSEMTVATESTWRTWNVDQKQATSRKKAKHGFLR